MGIFTTFSGVGTGPKLGFYFALIMIGVVIGGAGGLSWNNHQVVKAEKDASQRVVDSTRKEAEAIEVSKTCSVSLTAQINANSSLRAAVADSNFQLEAFKKHLAENAEKSSNALAAAMVLNKRNQDRIAAVERELKKEGQTCESAAKAIRQSLR